MKTVKFTSRCPADTQAAAARLLQRIPTRTGVLALHGRMGAGKTCFVQGLAAALGIRRPVTSPTFTIVNEYAAEPRLVHIDLYRISDPEETFAFGLEEYFDGRSLVAIEWAERAGDLLPPGTVNLHFSAPELAGARTIEAVFPD